MKKLNNKLGQLIITAVMLIPLSNAFANHPVKIETKSSDIISFKNVTAVTKNDSINITGGLVSNSEHHIIPGKVKIDLLDDSGSILKTVNVQYKRHKHRINNSYMFNKHMSITSLHVNKIRVMYVTKSQY